MQKKHENRAAAARESYLRRREKIIAERKLYRAKFGAEINARRRTLYASSTDKQLKIWASNLRRRCGCTPEQYQGMWDRQDGCCAVCLRELITGTKGDKRACVDHDHETGAVRGLLCHRCNVFLGMLDNHALRDAAMNYQQIHATGKKAVLDGPA